MKLIVGLGNPGEKYENTRHNLGFAVLDQFLKDFQEVSKTVWEESPRFKSSTCEIEWQRKNGEIERIILAKPKTYMNNSGLSVSLISSYFKIPPSDIWVVHDEIDLPLGTMKIRLGGGTAGHKGVWSILEKMGTENFLRFRLGISSPRTKDRRKVAKIKMRETNKIVLSQFKKGEIGKVRGLIKRASNALSEGLENGLEKAMNRYNTK